MGGTPRNPTFTILTGVLAVGVILAITFLALLLRGPGGTDALLKLAGPKTTTCPKGSGVPVCYGADVTNVGTAQAMILCSVEGGPGTSATFGNREPQYLTPVPVQPGSSLPLTMLIRPDADTATAPPSLSCSVAG